MVSEGGRKIVKYDGDDDNVDGHNRMTTLRMIIRTFAARYTLYFVTLWVSILDG